MLLLGFSQYICMQMHILCRQTRLCSSQSLQRETCIKMQLKQKITDRCSKWERFKPYFRTHPHGSMSPGDISYVFLSTDGNKQETYHHVISVQWVNTSKMDAFFPPYPEVITDQCKSGYVETCVPHCFNQSVGSLISSWKGGTIHVKGIWIGPLTVLCVTPSTVYNTCGVGCHSRSPEKPPPKPHQGLHTRWAALARLSQEGWVEPLCDKEETHTPLWHLITTEMQTLHIPSCWPCCFVP